MENEKAEQDKGAAFVGQIYDVRTKKDGGGRIQIDFGIDGLDYVQWCQKIAAKENVNFMVALVPIAKGD